MGWRKLPLAAADWPPPESNPAPYAGLLSSLPREYDYACGIEGELPDLSGTLYGVGPGLYDRGPERKRMVLDGDGMVQALTLGSGVARYRNRFVRTPKYLDEERAGRFLYPTFSTHGSGPLHHNLGIKIPNQANTTVIEWAGRVWAFDEGQKPFALDPGLATLGEHTMDARQPGMRYWAHWKLDADQRCLHLLSMAAGPKPAAHVVSLDSAGRVMARQSVPLPRSVYIHDWFVSAKHFAFLLHPAFISLPRMLQILIGRETFANAIDWRPERGTVLTVARRGGGDGEVRHLETQTSWMWHAINAFDDGEDLVLDYIGAEMAGAGSEDDSPFCRVMRGEDPAMPGEPVSWPRRLRVPPTGASLVETALLKDANFELPAVPAPERGRPHTKAYMIRAETGEAFARSLCELDGLTGEARRYEFGAREFCSEPVVCDHVDGAPGRYLLTQVYSGERKRSYFAVLDRQNFTAGPVAKLHLRHHVPVSFHGYWSPGAATGK
jgi:all-trans-8'-apo-beta-carotenal 15,15'-oxygenase